MVQWLRPLFVIATSRCVFDENPEKPPTSLSRVILCNTCYLLRFRSSCWSWGTLQRETSEHTCCK